MDHPAPEKTRLTLETYHGTYTIEVPESDMTLTATVNTLVWPIMMAAGYQLGSINTYLDSC